MTMYSFIVSSLLVFGFSLSYANTVPYVDENDILHERYSMIQTHTGFTQTEIHAVLPRIKNYHLKIQEIQDERLVGEPILIGPNIEARDPQRVLHKKINVFYIDGLKPNSEYHLTLVETGLNATERVEDVASGDTRRFRTLNPNQSSVRFTTASCLCDEIRYNSVKLPMWTQKRLTKPDFMVLAGDVTYVDAFDYVKKSDMTVLDIWQRYLDNFTDMPGTKLYRLTPIISTMDDHDIYNGANKNAKYLKESVVLFNILWGGRTIPDIIENGNDGTYKQFTYGGVEFFVLDARTFRDGYDTPTKSERYGHFGKEQEEWFFNRAAKTKKPLVLIKGDMWGSKLVTEKRPDGSLKRIIEGFYADHPVNHAEFMLRLQSLPNPFVLYSGDIHRAQTIRLGPNQSPSRFNPYETREITSSAFHSHKFNAQDPNAPGWDDTDRIATKNIDNFALTDVDTSGSEIKFKVEIRGHGKKDENGMNRDWRTLAKPEITDEWTLKKSYPTNNLLKNRQSHMACLNYYR